MVRKHDLLARSAFTLIELIFAIVVIAISVVSLPMMLQVNAKGMEGNLVQEAIFASVAELTATSTAVWDVNSLSDFNDTSELSRIVDTGDCAKNDLPSSINTRLGNVNRPIAPNTKLYNRICLSDTAPSFFHTEYPVDYAIHDWNATFIENEDLNLSNGFLLSAQGYKKAYYSKLDVNLCSVAGTCITFGNTVNNKDLKEITLTIRNSDDVNITVLRTYVANVGEVNNYHKVLP
ncbi:MAG: prepilin-type N-terminal cleavage/methylation domain-containing protein [Sulfurimonas sp.]